MAMMYFQDREDAARQLAEELKSLELRDPVVLGIPRGGVVTAAVIARELGAECDVVIVRKLRAPSQPELAIGAVSEAGDVHLSEEARLVPGVTDEYLDDETEGRRRELEERGRMFREIRPAAEVEGRSVIVTDDGIATGSTMIAALQVLRRRNPHELICAVPVAPASRVASIEAECDRFVCPHAPESFMAIGQFYDVFDQVSDDEATKLLRETLTASAR